jgi:hypothetical protein
MWVRFLCVKFFICAGMLVSLFENNFCSHGFVLSSLSAGTGRSSLLSTPETTMTDEESDPDSLKMQDPDTEPDSVKLNPKHWLPEYKVFSERREFKAILKSLHW